MACVLAGVAMPWLNPAPLAAQAGPSGVLTEEQVVRWAQERPGMAAWVDGEVEAARGAGLEAGLWPNPELGWAREQTLDGPAASTEDYLTVSQALDLSGGRGLRAEAGQDRARAAGHAGESRRLELAATARLRFFEVLALQERVRAAEEWARRVDDSAGVLARRAAAGDVAAYDVKRLEREQAAVRARTAEVRAALAAARERLAALLGAERPGPAWSAAGELLPGDPTAGEEDLLGRVERRPDLLALSAEAEAADKEARAARRGWMTDVTLLGGLKTAEVGPERATGFMLGVSLPLPVASRRQGEALAAGGRSRAALARRDLALDEARGEVRALARAWTGLARAARELRGEALGPSRELARTAEAAYHGGEIGVLELLDAHRGVFEATAQVLDLELAARRARIELDRLTGGEQ
jgi:cobalt-zinc-cadmium efflux system outer membrane protein